jgi:hypothetical protein
MTARKRNAIRVTTLLFWLILALLTVGPVLAQGDGGAETPQGGVQAQNPQDLNDIAVRLAPLLAGAALIERAMEFLFNWTERAIMDASHYLNSIAARATGLVQVDLRQAWKQLGELQAAMLARQAGGAAPDEGDPNSSNIQEWPLAKLEAQLAETQKQLKEAESTIESAMNSDLYKSRKKMAAGWLSIIMGLALAVSANLRLFEPMGVQVADWFQDPFNVVDTVLAGILMGLGTDWVHQVIGLVIQGKGFLGRAGGGGQYDVGQVQALASQAVQQAFEEQAQKLRDELTQQLGQAGRSGPPPH